MAKSVMLAAILFVLFSSPKYIYEKKLKGNVGWAWRSRVPGWWLAYWPELTVEGVRILPSKACLDSEEVK